MFEMKRGNGTGVKTFGTMGADMGYNENRYSNRISDMFLGHNEKESGA